MSFMDTDEHKSVAVDYDTWETLVRWSEKECRTVGGQIRYLVKQYSPKEKPISLPSPEHKGKTKPVVGESVFRRGEDGWAQKKCQSDRVTLKNTQRYAVMDLLREYEGPMTNKEIFALVPESWDRLSRNNSLEAVQKITAAMFSGGFVKRRRSLIIKENSDKFQYQLTVASHRILKMRDKKRKASGWEPEVAG
jgi:hypothetical protein